MYVNFNGSNTLLFAISIVPIKKDATLLIMASYYGHEDVVSVLLKHGANIHDVDKVHVNFYVPFRLTSRYTNKYVAVYLQGGQSALSAAQSQHNEDVILLLTTYANYMEKKYARYHG